MRFLFSVRTFLRNNSHKTFLFRNNFVSMGDSENNTTSKKECIYPKWIKAELFEDVLKEVEPEFKQVLQFTIDYALAPGENYNTIMLKPQFEIKLNDDSTKTVSFMMKVGQDTELYREMLKPHNVFDVEMGIYADVIPELQEMFLDAGLNVRFSPKAYKLPTDEMHMLLENLKTQGFRNSNRLEGLDMKHSKCVLQKLAQWHAASAVRVATKGRYPDYIAKGYIKPQCYEIVKGLYENSKQVLLQCIKEYSNSDMYYDKVVQLQNNIVDELYKTIEREEDGDVFKVLTHGDIWSNNIMFKYDEDNGEVLETYFVDFQTPRYTSPAPDLLYFILSSCKYEIKLEKFDYLVAFYHKHLIENLRLLKYAKYVPTLKDIHYMVYRHGVWGYATVTIVMAAALCDPCKNADLGNILSESENATIFRRQMYSNPRYRKHMEAILPWLLNRGLLDC